MQSKLEMAFRPTYRQLYKCKNRRLKAFFLARFPQGDVLVLNSKMLMLFGWLGSLSVHRAVEPDAVELRQHLIEWIFIAINLGQTFPHSRQVR
jgi:hypothetical protein